MGVLWVALLLVLATGIAHLFFFYTETLSDKAENLLRPLFQNKGPNHDHMVPVLFRNQGVYNLFLGLGTLWRLISTNIENIPNDTTLIYLLSFIVLVGLYGLITVRHKLFFAQIGPAAFALVILLLARS